MKLWAKAKEFGLWLTADVSGLETIRLIIGAFTAYCAFRAALYLGAIYSVLERLP